MTAVFFDAACVILYLFYLFTYCHFLVPKLPLL